MRTLEQGERSLLVLRSTGARTVTVELSSVYSVLCKAEYTTPPRKRHHGICKTVTPGSSKLIKLVPIYFRTPQTEAKWKNTETSKELSNWQFCNSIMKNIVHVFLKGKC